MIAERQGLRIKIEGAVQGVGFRPFVYRLAHELGLTGYVRNTPNGVLIELDGSSTALDRFSDRLVGEKPPLAVIHRVTTETVPPVGHSTFRIQVSQTDGSRTAFMLPDIAICPECHRDILDPHNRRYRYPFTNCTNCGPRYSIIRTLPYDRAHTSMHQFVMCPACQAEYQNPLDRRFHAQPNACPVCGPHLELWDSRGRVLSAYDDALVQAANAIREGQIVALKGLGGFQLLVDARKVQRLRTRKQRPDKPLAVMVPSLDWLNEWGVLTPLEANLLSSPPAPIVLLPAASSVVAPIVAPQNPNLGVMLPYTPLHHLLLAELGFPIVATSGNLSGEPICIDEYEALDRLADIADRFLVHNRPIVRQVDDSVVQVVGGQVQVLRRARGYAPLPIELNKTLPAVLGVGGHLKNTVAASIGSKVFISQHIGDLETIAALRVFERTIADFESNYDWSPQLIAHDLHPDYQSTHYASNRPQPKIAVQHHFAHVLSCMAENRVNAPVLGVCWDGTGYGTDGTIWGGEWLLVRDDDFERVGHLRTFRLPGGDQAVQEPRRSALGLLYELFGDAAFALTDLAPISDFTAQERRVLKAMFMNSLNSPVTSSAGRLFDGVAAILDLCQHASFEGQAAMALEATASHSQLSYETCFTNDALNWEPLLLGILNDWQSGLEIREISAKFHNTLVEMIVSVAQQVGEPNVLLTGGCFQNKYLTERAIERLRAAGFIPHWQQRIPPNDGGIALGQVMAAANHYERLSSCV